MTLSVRYFRTLQKGTIDMLQSIEQEQQLSPSESNRMTLLYYRTSSNSQNEEMQIAAAHTLVRNLGLKNVLEFNDHGVSATKVSLSKRPKLNEVLNLIKEKRVENLVVFARDRLARDTYEYSKIISILYEQNVNVYFTMQNTPTFRRDRVFELIYSTFCENEGKQIASRTHESNKRFPPRIYGYRKQVKEGIKSYLIDDLRAPQIINLYHDCRNIHSIGDFLLLLEKYSKIIARHPGQILTILQNPFYTGHIEHGDKLLKLNHVEPIIPIELFQDVRNKAIFYGKEILDDYIKPDYLYPLCGVCGQKMNLIGRSIINAGRFLCRNNHQSISISVDELENETKIVLQHFVDHISINKLEKLTRGFLLKHLQRLDAEFERLGNMIDNEYYRFCVDFSPAENDHASESKIEFIKKLENEQQSCKFKKHHTETILQEIENLALLLHQKTVFGK